MQHMEAGLIDRMPRTLDLHPAEWAVAVGRRLLMKEKEGKRPIVTRGWCLEFRRIHVYEARSCRFWQLSRKVLQLKGDDVDDV